MSMFVNTVEYVVITLLRGEITQPLMPHQYGREETQLSEYCLAKLGEYM